MNVQVVIAAASLVCLFIQPKSMLAQETARERGVQPAGVENSAPVKDKKNAKTRKEANRKATTDRAKSSGPDLAPKGTCCEK